MAGLGFDVEVTANISKAKARIFEIPLSYYERTNEEGKKISYIDGILAFFYIFKFNLLSSSSVKK